MSEGINATVNFSGNINESYLREIIEDIDLIKKLEPIPRQTADVLIQVRFGNVRGFYSVIYSDSSGGLLEYNGPGQDGKFLRWIRKTDLREAGE